MTAKVALIYSSILGEHLKCLYSAHFILRLNVEEIFWHSETKTIKIFILEINILLSYDSLWCKKWLTQIGLLLCMRQQEVNVLFSKYGQLAMSET